MDKSTRAGTAGWIGGGLAGKGSASAARWREYASGSASAARWMMMMMMMMMMIVILLFALKGHVEGCKVEGICLMIRGSRSERLEVGILGRMPASGFHLS